MKRFNKYILNDGSIYWHKLYFDLMPEWMCKYSPPLGFYNYAAYLYQPHKYVIELYKQGKWFIQRGYRGYADCDVWSIDSYLAKWMPHALLQLKRTKMGYPAGSSEENWDDKLNKMIRCFETAKKIQNWEFGTPEEAKALHDSFKRDFDIIKNNFFHLWD